MYASVVYQSYISFMCTHLSYTGFMCTHLSYTSRISVLFMRICHKYQFYVYASVVYQSYTSLMCVHLSFTSLYQLYLYLEIYRNYQTGIIKYMYIYINIYLWLEFSNSNNKWCHLYFRSHRIFLYIWQYMYLVSDDLSN